MSNFHPLEIVGRGSETQLQVGGNLHKLPWPDEGYSEHGICLIQVFI